MTSGQPQGLVSVIVAAYNYGHFIGQTLDSLAAQTYENWECLVLDDGSTDNTREVILTYAQKDRWELHWTVTRE